MTAHDLALEIDRLINRINALDLIEIVDKASPEDRLELIKALENLKHFSSNRLSALLI